MKLFRDFTLISFGIAIGGGFLLISGADYLAVKDGSPAFGIPEEVATRIIGTMTLLVGVIGAACTMLSTDKDFDRERGIEPRP